MNSIAEIKEACIQLYKTIDDFVEALDIAFKKREADIDRQMAEVKLVDEKLKLLAAEKTQFEYDKDMLAKQQTVLQEKQQRLEGLDKKLQEKAERLQKIMAN